MTRNSAFDCHLSPVGRQMAIANSVSKALFPFIFDLYTFVDSNNVFDCRQSGVVIYILFSLQFNVETVTVDMDAPMKKYIQNKLAWCNALWVFGFLSACCHT